MTELIGNFNTLKGELVGGKFATLPLFSRNLRLIVGGIESEMEGRERECLPLCLPRGTR